MTTIRYVIFFTLFFGLISLFLPVVTELPFGIEPFLIQAVGVIRQLFVCLPILEQPYELFKISIYLLFLYLSFQLLMFFITRGKSKAP